MKLGIIGAMDVEVNKFKEQMIGVSIETVSGIDFVCGTLWGNPTVVAYTREDLANWSEQVARIAYAAGATDESIVQICFGYGMFTGALGLHYGLERIGATVVPTSSGNTEKQLQFMRDMKATVLCATSSYALLLAEEIARRGYNVEHTEQYIENLLQQNNSVDEARRLRGLLAPFADACMTP